MEFFVLEVEPLILLRTDEEEGSNCYSALLEEVDLECCHSRNAVEKYATPRERAFTQLICNGRKMAVVQ